MVFEKKNQKTFTLWASAVLPPKPRFIKVFSDVAFPKNKRLLGRD
jgi:hypothetical protein